MTQAFFKSCLAKRAAACRAYFWAISIPKKSCSRRLLAAVLRNNPLPLPISTSSGARRPNKASASNGWGSCSSGLNERERSRSAETLRNDRRAMGTTCETTAPRQLGSRSLGLLADDAFGRQGHATELAFTHQRLPDEALEAANDHCASSYF